MATVRLPSTNRLTNLAFALRQHLGLELIDTEPARNGGRRGASAIDVEAVGRQSWGIVAAAVVRGYDADVSL